MVKLFVDPSNNLIRVRRIMALRDVTAMEEVAYLHGRMLK